MASILCISGTNRPDNYTARALRVVSDELNKGEAEVEFVDARELELRFPGVEPTADAKRLVASVQRALGIVFATPEYHGGFSAYLKLIIENLGFPSALKGKAVGLLGVAGGRIGAVKSLEQLRGVCAHTGAVVMPGALSVAGVRDVFAPEGSVKPEAEEALRTFAGSFCEFLKNYIQPRIVLEEIARSESTPWVATI
jgi:NAD(P)H-dependent FMN reductase